MHKHIIIISLDALGTEDFNKIKDTEGFRYLIENGSFSSNVRSVYPSLTYPAHATIVTGKLPRNHGVINNTKIQPDRSNPDWYWFKKDIKGETLYDIARKQKKTVASLLWPVTGRSGITYNLPEIFPVKPYQTQVSQVLTAGSPIYCLELDKKFSHLRQGIEQPYLDNFTHECAKYTLKKYSPYMTLIHYVELDSMRHIHGFDSKEAGESLVRHGEKIKDWIDFLRAEEKLEDTLIVVLGDHSHLPVDKVIKPNVFLKKLGLIRMLENDIIDWKAYFKSCDGSGYIYVKNKKDTELLNLIRDNLTVLSAYEENGIKNFIDGRFAGIMGADQTCTFMLEAQRGYYFSESPIGEYIEDTKDENGPIPGFLQSSHGYHPSYDDYKTVFIMAGPGVNKGVEVPDLCLIDEGPTIAKLMGSSLWGVDGRIRYEFIDHDSL